MESTASTVPAWPSPVISNFAILEFPQRNTTTEQSARHSQVVLSTSFLLKKKKSLQSLEIKQKCYRHNPRIPSKI